MANPRFLLTGAGFTHNFGTPLAGELWAVILNHPKVHEYPRIKQALLSDFDFESVYHHVVNGGYTPDEIKALTDAVSYSYAYIDEIVRKWGFRRDAPYPVNVYKVQEMISAFSSSSRSTPGFIFTLNQDLFLERHHYNGEAPCLPGVQHKSNWFSSHFRDAIGSSDYCDLPSEQYLNQEGTSILSSHKFHYLKLHGSCNWRSAITPQQMVIGQGKKNMIDQEPLLKWYLQVFSDQLKLPNARLLVIGYGFGDSHINEIIADSVTSSNLKVYIMTPEPPQALNNRLVGTVEGKTIWSGLGGYFHWTLGRMFPGDQSETAEWRTIKDQFFDGQLR